MFDVFARSRAVTTDRLSNATSGSRATARKPAPVADGLLGEVLARLPGIKQPLIQIVSASASTDPMHAARALAASAARCCGRTLLISSDESELQDGSVRGLSWLMQELRVEKSEEVVPDSAIAGLYHARVRRKGQPLRPLSDWFVEPQGFRMLVVASSAVTADPHTIDTAIACHGSILAVTAGVTNADQVLSATRQLTCAGVRILGTVLVDAPDLDRTFLHLRRAG